MKYFIICMCSILFSIKVEYVNAYYDILIDNDLYSPQINQDNSIISAEVYTKKNDLVDDAIQNNDELILFKNNGNSFSSFRLFENIYEVWGEYEAENYNLSYADWSTYDPKVFYSIKTGRDADFYYLKLDTLVNDLSLNQAKLRDADDEEDPGIKSMGNEGWGDFDYNPKSIYQHKIVFDKDEDAEFNYVLFRESSQNKILTNHPNMEDKDGSIIKEKLLTKQKSACIIKDNCPISNLKTDLTEFDVVKNGTKLDFVYQIRNDEYQSSIILHRGCFGLNEFIPIVSKDSKISKSQINPIFNYGGDKISFLSRQNSDKSYLYDLYVVDLPIKENEDVGDCYDFKDDIRNGYNLRYRLIDTNLMDEDFYDSGERSNFTSHCWHPEKDIIFYIKSDQDDTESRSESIYYYNLKTNQGGKLDIPTKNNKYINISDDGQYLLFSFIGVNDSAIKDDFQFNNSEGLEKSDVLMDFGNSKIGVAKLIYD